VTESSPSRERGLDVDRLVYFSDAVFAIAMTVLVLSLHLPSVPGQKLGHVLRHLVPSIWSYFLSFAVELQGQRIAIFPFPTDVLGTYGQHPLGTMCTRRPRPWSEARLDPRDPDADRARQALWPHVPRRGYALSALRTSGAVAAPASSGRPSICSVARKSA
jgi:hypothetical protein